MVNPRTVRGVPQNFARYDELNIISFAGNNSKNCLSPDGIRGKSEWIETGEFAENVLLVVNRAATIDEPILGITLLTFMFFRLYGNIAGSTYSKYKYIDSHNNYS